MNLDVKNLIYSEIGRKEVKIIDLIEKKDEDFNAPTLVSGLVELINVDDGIIANFKIDSESLLACDRCQMDFVFKKHLSFSRYYVLGQSDTDSEAILLGKNLEIDFWDPVREELILSIPFQKICQENCNGLCVSCGINLNKGKCACGKQEDKGV